MQKFLDVLAGGKSVQVPATLVFDGTGAAQPPATIPPPTKKVLPPDYFNPETGQYQETPYVAPIAKQAPLPVAQANQPFSALRMQVAFADAVKKPDLIAPGQAMYSSVMDGFYKSFDGAGISTNVSGKLLADFAANGGAFVGAGTFAGGQVLAGVVQACQAGNKDIIDAIAGSVAPSVGKILNRNGPQRSLDNSCW
jgi:hypothetical protein